MSRASVSSQIALVAVVLVMTLSANLPEGLLAQYSVSQDALIVGLTIMLAIALIRYVQFALVLVIAILALGANLPDDLAEHFGTSPAVLTATLAVTVGLALLNYVWRFLPTGTEVDRAQGTSTSEGVESLIATTRRGDVRYMRALLRLGVTPNERGENGETALTAAARLGYADAVQLLLHHGADPGLANRAGETPMDLAMARGFTRSAGLIDAHARFPEHGHNAQREQRAALDRTNASQRPETT